VQAADAGPFDLLVIGGGINGAAIARDAALRGLSVLLVERDDWAGGTTAKSSRLAHGGLRYLELLEFALVREALEDRERLLTQAPHLVRPLRFVYPIYPEVVAKRTVRLGLWLYDVLSRRKSLPKRGHLSKRAALELVPTLEPARLAGAATFFDGQIQSVERLVVEMVADARRHNATALSRTTVVGLEIEGSGRDRRATGARLRDETGREWAVHAKAIVNAAGCWVDDVLGPLAAGRPPKIRKTKGIHIAVPRFLDVALMVRAKDGRSFFVLPWGDDCIVGTTDTDFGGDARDAVASPAEVAYLVDSARRYFPAAPLDQVRYTYAGVRALVNQPKVSESNVTRRHIVYDHGREEGIAGLWTLQGGKITTARTLAEEVVDFVGRHLGRSELARLHPTRRAPYPGAPAEAWDGFVVRATSEAERELGIDAQAAHRLVSTYGTRWRDVAACGVKPGAAGVAAPAGGPMPCEVAFAVREEDARHVADFMFRRSGFGFAPGGNPDVARVVLSWMAGLLGWDAARQAEEWRLYQGETTHFYVPSPG
jgi:glycerol-3-phosphate dehydrogenase